MKFLAVLWRSPKEKYNLSKTSRKMKAIEISMEISVSFNFWETRLLGSVSFSLRTGTCRECGWTPRSNNLLPHRQSAGTLWSGLRRARCVRSRQSSSDRFRGSGPVCHAGADSPNSVARKWDPCFLRAHEQVKGFAKIKFVIELLKVLIHDCHLGTDIRANQSM